MVTAEIETMETSITKDLRTLSRLAWLIAERSDGNWIFRFQPLVQKYLQEQLGEQTEAHELAINYYIINNLWKFPSKSAIAVAKP